MFFRFLFTTLSLLSVVASSKEARAELPDLQTMNQMKDALVQQICSDGGEWVKCFNLQPRQCRDVAASTVVTCLPMVLENYPKDNPAEGTRVMIACMNNIFYKRFGAGAKSTACKVPFS